MTKAFDIVAYTYRADTLDPECMIEQGIAEGWLAPAARGMRAEDALEQAQHHFGIDRMDEYSYDSDTFPKVVFNYQTEGEHCGRCARAI